MKAIVTPAGGKFYITPTSVGLNGVAFKTRGEAEYIANAINSAFERGKEEIRSGLRDLIGAAEEKDC